MGIQLEVKRVYHFIGKIEAIQRSALLEKGPELVDCELLASLCDLMEATLDIALEVLR